MPDDRPRRSSPSSPDAPGAGRRRRGATSGRAGGAVPTGDRRWQWRQSPGGRARVRVATADRPAEHARGPARPGGGQSRADVAAAGPGDPAGRAAAARRVPAPSRPTSRAAHRGRAPERRRCDDGARTRAPVDPDLERRKIEERPPSNGSARGSIRDEGRHHAAAAAGRATAIRGRPGRSPRSSRRVPTTPGGAARSSAWLRPRRRSIASASTIPDGWSHRSSASCRWSPPGTRSPGLACYRMGHWRQAADLARAGPPAACRSGAAAGAGRLLPGAQAVDRRRAVVARRSARCRRPTR